MQQQENLPGIPTPDEEARANFKLDSERSFAQLVITPVHAISDDEEKDFIAIEETLEIFPYPNPYGFGGHWGHGWYPPEDKERIVASFKQEVGEWVKRGLTRVEIKTEPVTTEHVLTEAQRREALEKATRTAAEKQKPKQQPALF